MVDATEISKSISISFKITNPYSMKRKL